MVLTANSPGIIDFQDAVIGPITYDLVSLLRDCYISWPENKTEQWATAYFQRISKAGLINVPLKTFTRWFDLMGIQRHLKAIGIFHACTYVITNPVIYKIFPDFELCQSGL